MTKAIHWAAINSSRRLKIQGFVVPGEFVIPALRAYVDKENTEKILDFLEKRIECSRDHARWILDRHTIEVGATFMGQVNPSAIGGYGGLNSYTLREDGWRDGTLIEFTATGDDLYPYAATFRTTYRTFKNHEVLA
jgi:hypothetical protein